MFNWIIIDGYNLLYQIPSLKELLNVSIEQARHDLIDQLSSYQGFAGAKITVVFDGYKTSKIGNSLYDYRNIEVIFSSKKKTADSVVEKMVYDQGDKAGICVVTSDRLFRMIVFGMGVHTMSGENFLREMENEMQDSLKHVKTYKKLNNRIFL